MPARSVKSFLKQAYLDFRYVFHTRPFTLLQTDYDTYWADRETPKKQPALNSYQKFRADWILSRISPEDKILDIAAGTGVMQAYFLERGFKNLVALENSTYCVEQLKTLGIEVIEKSVSDSAALESLPAVDVIILSEILEHLSNPEQVLLTLRQKARKAVFFSFPNTGYYAERLRLLGGKFPVQWKVYPGEHLRFWTLADLKHWLRCIGLMDHATICVYEGLPGLNRVLPGLFGKAFIVEIKA